MALVRCYHLETAKGVFRCDVSRNGEARLYSTDLSARICVKCGHVELFCKAHGNLCAWLAGKEHSEPSSAPKPNLKGKGKRKVRD
jgi:hypothetical protein